MSDQQTDPARDKRLFDTFRAILGRSFTQSEVDRINAALYASIVTAATGGMKTSRAGVNFIHSFESFRDTTYADPGSGGKPYTGGWGTTTDENGKPFSGPGITKSREYWDALFARDLAAFEIGVNSLLRGGGPTTQPQFDALVSFAYNVGLDMDGDGKAEGLGDSTLLKKHKAGDYAGAAAEFVKWNKAAGKVMAGLTRRRTDEANIYRGA